MVADWSFVERVKKVNDACSICYAALYNICNLCILFYNSRKEKNSNPPWFSQEIKKINKQKSQLLTVS